VPEAPEAPFHLAVSRVDAVQQRRGVGVVAHLGRGIPPESLHEGADRPVVPERGLRFGQGEPGVVGIDRQPVADALRDELLAARADLLVRPLVQAEAEEVDPDRRRARLQAGAERELEGRAERGASLRQAAEVLQDPRPVLLGRGDRAGVDAGIEARERRFKGVDSLKWTRPMAASARPIQPSWPSLAKPSRAASSCPSASP